MAFTLVKYGEDVMTVRTYCPLCRQTTDFEVPTAGVDAYGQGLMIQDAFPTLNADQREQLKTGTCPDCWNKIFPPDPPAPGSQAEVDMANLFHTWFGNSR